MNLPLVVLAAGRGSRMAPLSATRPKVLMPVAGRPLMDHVVQAAVDAGVRQVVYVVHAGADQVREHVAQQKSGFLDGIDVAFIEQGQAGGTGQAIASLQGHVGDAVVVSGDSVLSTEDLVALAQGPPAVACHDVPDVSAYGALNVSDGRVHGVVEKGASGPGIANAGAYRIDTDMIGRAKQLAPSPRGELEFTDAITARGLDDPLHAQPVQGWLEAGRPWELLDLQKQLGADLEPSIRGHVGSRVDMEGAVFVDEGASIHNGCRIEGPVWIGRGARIGPNAYVRGATTIGAGCHIGAGVEIKNSIIMANSNVPHLSYVGDSVIGANCNLGAGTQVANLKTNDRAVRVQTPDGAWLDTGRRKLGCIFGDGVKTGVNASIMPGTAAETGAQLAAGTVHYGWIPSAGPSRGHPLS